ncbi:MAG: hypothetical protein NC111_05265 [Bacteroides sp.]|nr:hypothetical protein [Bacteroides sp.]MCM1413397.1 hypothetical protein [Bacteroides sp.]MCM1471917.1 hypothetical protein [Bacteroides sp.]
MKNILIYGGLGLLLVGTLFGLMAAAIGCKIQGWKVPDIFMPRMFFGKEIKMTPAMKRCLWFGGSAWVIGAVAIITAISISI